MTTARARLWRALKHPSLLLMLLGLTAALSCSRGASKDQKIVVFGYGGGSPISDQTYDEMIARFEAENPDVRVFKHAYTGVTDLKRYFYLSTLLSKSTFIDVFEMDVIWGAEFAAGGLLKPIALEGEARGRFVESILEGGSYDGALYAQPLNISYLGLYHRKDLLEKHGLQPPKTWEELAKQAKLIADKEGIAGFLWEGRQYEGLVCNVLSVYYNLGGAVIRDGGALKLDAAKLTQALTTLRGLITSGASPDDVLDYTEAEAGEAFASGEAAFMLNWQYASMLARAGEVGDRFAITPPPGEGIAVTGGWYLAINKNATAPEAAQRFARFLAGEEIQRELTVKKGQGPVVKSAYAEGPEGAAWAEAWSKSTPQLMALRQLVKGARGRPATPYYQQFTELVAREAHAALRGEVEPEAAAKAIVEASAKLKLHEVAAPDFPERLVKWHVGSDWHMGEAR